MGPDAQDTLRQWLERHVLIYDGKEGETRIGRSTQKRRNKRAHGESDAMILSGLFPKRLGVEGLVSILWYSREVLGKS